MSDFLVLKSTEEQKDDGVEQPVDTAYIDDRDGMPMLKAVFDVHHFKPEEVPLLDARAARCMQSSAPFFSLLFLLGICSFSLWKYSA